MAPLLFTCPKTNQRAPTGIETDVQSLSISWKATLKVNCPRCGEVHEISGCSCRTLALYETTCLGALHEQSAARQNSYGGRVRGVPTFAERRSRRPGDLPPQPASSIVYIAFDYFKGRTLQGAWLISAFPPKADN
jgi:hypothetical protein